MPMDRFGVWSPHRNSNSVRSFKAALGFRSEPWKWYDEEHLASWWVIDGTLVTPTSLNSLTDALAQQRKQRTVEAVLLVPSGDPTEDPAWTSFKTPLNVKLLYGWMAQRLEQSDPAAGRPPVSPAVLTGRQLKLSRWPNLAHYTAYGDPADAVSVTVACSKLLEGWTSYEEAAALASNTALFNAILADAQSQGILQINETASAPVQPAIFTPPKTSETSDAWSLVRRLLKKFT